MHICTPLAVCWLERQTRWFVTQLGLVKQCFELKEDLWTCELLRWVQGWSWSAALDYNHLTGS